MNSIQDLLQIILRHDYVVVFGNLGRYPRVLFDAFLADSQLNVAIYSPYYLCSSTPDERIRVVKSSKVQPCDLYVVLEPPPYQLLEKPAQATRMVVFTSHFTYKTHPENVWTFVSFFHTLNVTELARNTQELLSLQDHSIQTPSIHQVQVDAVHKVTLSGRADGALDNPNTYVLINLSGYSSPFHMFLAIWDSFDYMLTNKNFVKKWMICFPHSGGRKAFDQFLQNCLDNLFCKKFEHGNVTSIGNILSLMPFYKSGCIHQTFSIPKGRILGVEYVAPITLTDACKAATMYNLEHWVGNVYRIKD
ncbi:uncharacterized protein TNCV_3285611 [Trichonephila clavipes]|nr:uncharacterized protein TNCV_3285611 [Trichonephila clavipes]